MLFINSILFLLLSIRLIYVENKRSEIQEENKRLNRKIYHVENAVYKISDLKGDERPKLTFTAIISDIINLKSKANGYDSIKPEYDEFVEKQIVVQALRNDFRKDDFTKKFIAENMPNELIAIELLKNKKALDKRNHVKDNTIYELRKIKGIKAPKRNKKAGHKAKK